MGIISLLQIDLGILHFFNGSGNMLMDQMVVILTSGLTWIPLYLTLFYVVMRNNETMPQIGLVVLSAALCILFADGLVDGIIKPLVARWRPSNIGEIHHLCGEWHPTQGLWFLFGSCSQHDVDSGLLLLAHTKQDDDHHDGGLVVAQLLDTPLSRRSLSERHPLWIALGCSGGLLGIYLLLQDVLQDFTQDQVHLQSIHQHGLRLCRLGHVPVHLDVHPRLCIRPCLRDDGEPLILKK